MQTLNTMRLANDLEALALSIREEPLSTEGLEPDDKRVELAASVSKALESISTNVAITNVLYMILGSLNTEE